MKPIWQTPEGPLLVQREAQYLPYAESSVRAFLEGACDYELVDPATGAVLERWRRDCTFDREESGFRWTHHLVKEDTLVEVLVFERDSARDAPRPARILESTPLLTGLRPYEGPRWRTPDGRHLVEGAPLTSTYGGQPECPLIAGAHDYELVDAESGEVLAAFHGSDVVIGASDDEILTRYVVEGDALVEVVFDYHEDSCWGVGSVRGVKRTVRLTGLVPISEG